MVWHGLSWHHPRVCVMGPGDIFPLRSGTASQEGVQNSARFFRTANLSFQAWGTSQPTRMGNPSRGLPARGTIQRHTYDLPLPRDAADASFCVSGPESVSGDEAVSLRCVPFTGQLGTPSGSTCLPIQDDDGSDMESRHVGQMRAPAGSPGSCGEPQRRGSFFQEVCFGTLPICPLRLIPSPLPPTPQTPTDQQGSSVSCPM